MNRENNEYEEPQYRKHPELLKKNSSPTDLQQKSAERVHQE